MQTRRKNLVKICNYIYIGLAKVVDNVVIYIFFLCEMGEGREGV